MSPASRHAGLIGLALLAACLLVGHELARLGGAPVPFFPKRGSELTNSIGMRFVGVPAGKFLMGSPKEDKYCQHYEEPCHEVEITRPFFLGKFEVTQAQYRKVTGTNPSWHSVTGRAKDWVKGLDTDNFPVEAVTWDEAKAFCAKLSALPEERKAGRSYRLPTEAEWEYACRAGTKTAYCFGDTVTHEQANLLDRNQDREPITWLQRPAVVGSYPPNAWGLHDMHGNVREWCEDRFRVEYYKLAPKKDPPGPTAAEAALDDWRVFRVFRGGSYMSGGEGCSSSARLWSEPEEGSSTVGFRVVCVLAAWGR
jgi:formylglycine-generating enzyme required for sulfatase activity